MPAQDFTINVSVIGGREVAKLRADLAAIGRQLRRELGTQVQRMGGRFRDLSKVMDFTGVRVRGVSQALQGVSQGARRAGSHFLSFGGVTDETRGRLKSLATTLYISGGSFTVLGRAAARAALFMTVWSDITQVAAAVAANLTRRIEVNKKLLAALGIGARRSAQALGFLPSGLSDLEMSLRRSMIELKLFGLRIARFFTTPLGKAVTIVGALTTGLGALALTLAGFEEKLVRLRQVGGFSVQRMGELRDSIKLLQERLGIFTADQVVDALTTVVKAGFTLEEAMSSLTETAMKFAHVGQVEVVEAVEILSKAAKQTGLDWKTLSDAIIKAADISELEIQEVARTVLRGGSAIQMGVGMSTAELLALTTQLTRMGLEAETAGRAIRRMATEARQMQIGRITRQQQQALAIGGRAAQQALARFRAGMTDVLQFVKELHDAGLRAGEIMLLFGERGGQAAAVIGPAFQDILAAQDKIAQSAGLLDERYEELRETLSGQLRELVSMFERIKLDVLTPLLPLAKELLGIFSAVAKVLGAVFGILAPVMGLIGQAVRTMLTPFRWLLEYIGETHRMLTLLLSTVIVLGIRMGWWAGILTKLRTALFGVAGAVTSLRVAALGLLTALRVLLRTVLPIFLIFEGLSWLIGKIPFFRKKETAVEEEIMQETEKSRKLLEEVAANTAAIARNTAPERQLLRTNIEAVEGLGKMFYRLYGETWKQFTQRLVGMVPAPPTKQPKRLAVPLGERQEGFLGMVRGAAQMIVGEAGPELVAVLRNPQALLGAITGAGLGACRVLEVKIANIARAVFERVEGAPGELAALPQAVLPRDLLGQIRELLRGEGGGLLQAAGGLLFGVGGPLGGLMQAAQGLLGGGALQGVLGASLTALAGPLGPVVAGFAGPILSQLASGLMEPMRMLGGIAGLLEAPGEILGDLTADVTRTIGRVLGAPAELLGGLLGEGLETPGGLVPVGPSLIAAPAFAGMGAGTAVTIQITVNVQGGGSPQEIGQIIGAEIERRLSQFFITGMGAVRQRRESREQFTPMRE